MLLSALTSIALSASGPVVPESATPKKAETKYCREMGNASSRLYAVKVCKTRAQWRRWENCHGSSTRYCTPKKKKAVHTAALGRETAFPLNENSRIVCREVKETGTRIVVQQTCLPKREWDRMWIENSEGLRDLQGDHSKLNRGGPQ